MDIKQIQTFKQIVDSINKNDILNIDTQWEKICFEFNIDTSIYPPQEKNIQYNIKHYQLGIKIKELICNQTINLSETYDLMNALYYEQIIDNVKNDIYISIASRLRDVLNKFDEIKDSNPIVINDNWKKAIYILFIIANGDFNYNYISPSTTTHAQSIKNLIDLGYQVDWKNNPAFPSLPDTEIANKIEELITSIGKLDVICFCINNLPYNSNTKRYIVTQNTMYSNHTHFPFIYLLNIALKNLSIIQPNVSDAERKKQLKQLIYLVQNYINCYDLENFNPFIILHYKDLSYFLIKHVLFDTCFIPKQMSYEHSELLIKELFSWVKKDNKDLYCKIIQYLRILRYLNYILTQAPHPNLLIAHKKKLPLFIKKHLKDLSINVADVNKNFISPNAFNLDFNVSIFSNPIINLENNDILILPHPIFNYSFFEKVYSIIRTNIDNIKNIGYASKKVGEALETFIYNYLKSKTQNSIKLNSNKEYNICSDLQKKYSIGRKKGECDLILETDNEIWLFEIKAKPMTTKAMFGDIYSIIKDLSQSLLTSCEQALILKMLLLNERKIFFTDGTSINLNNRRIRTISLSLYDYGSLHTSAFITQFLGLIFQGIELTSKSEDPDYMELVNRINSIYNKIRTIGNGIKLNGTNSIREIIFSHQFLNISLLLQILKDYNGNIEKLLDILRYMESISYGMQDSYVNYLNIKKLLDNSK